MISINRKAVRAAGGTQSDELAAKIKSVTSSTTVGAVFVYDTRNDSDGGAWRKKCAGLSWFDEAASATRSSRSEFPSVALIVADKADGVFVYDLDDPSMPLAFKFEKGTNYLLNTGLGTFAGMSAFALNGRVFIGINCTSAGGLAEIDFANDKTFIHRAGAGTARGFHGTISQRNSAQTWLTADEKPLANQVVNDVAATYLEGGELDSLGLVRPVIACATDGGVSVIHPNGSVYDKATTSAAATIVKFDKDGNLYAGQGNYITRFDLNTLYADGSTTYLSTPENDGTIITIREFSHGSIPVLINNTTSLAVTDDGFAGGSASGLTQVKFNDGDHEDSAVAYITSTYNTGYMLGDIRFAGLAGSGQSGDIAADRSVKSHTLTKHGTGITDPVVATNAELRGITDFSADSYLSKSHTPDFDFGTGDFSIMFWVKYSSASGGEYLFARDTTSGSSNRIALFVGGSNFTVYAGTETDVSALDVDDGQWHQIGLVRTNGKLYTLENGKYGASGVNSTSSVTNGSAVLHIGQYTSGSSPAANASISLFRISATAPTPTQVKDIYEAEKPLFRAGAKCLLQHSTVHALGYDKSTDLLSVGQTAASGNEGVTKFRGLENVEQFTGSDHASWSGDSIKKISTAGGVSVYGRTDSTGGVLVDLPAIDVRGDINTADTKLPDDGKLHFSGVTTSNGGDVIGHIPIGENENVTVKAHVTAKGYGSNLGTHFANYVLTEQFYRAAGGDVTSAEAEASIVSQESAAGLDATLGVDTSADTAKITVTGDASDRIVWTASVEVIRDAEKSYER